MLDPHTRPPASHEQQRGAWKQTEGGALWVVLGLAALALFCLTSALALGASLTCVESGGRSVAVVLGVFQSGGFLLLVAGRLRCLAGPADASKPLVTSIIGPLASLATGAVGTSALFGATPGGGPVPKSVAFWFGLSLLAFVVGEFAFLRFLDRLGLSLGRVELRRHVEHFLPGCAVVALLIGMSAFGVVTALAPSGRTTAIEAAQFATAVTAGTAVALLGSVVLLGWYCRVAFEAWHAVKAYLATWDEVGALSLAWADPGDGPRETSVPPERDAEGDFESYFLEEAARAEARPPPDASA